MPPPDPVTMATLFSNRPMLFLSGLRLDRCRNGFDFQVLLETCETHLASVARLLVTAEGRVGRVPDAAVDVDGSHPQARREAGRALRVGAEHSAGQPIWRVVGDTKGVGVTVVGDHSEHRPEDLLPGGSGVVVQSGDDSGLDEEPAVPVGRSAAAARERPALRYRQVEVALHPVALPRRNNGPAHGSGLVGVARLDRARGAWGGR